jgi:hypothetical protein
MIFPFAVGTIAVQQAMLPRNGGALFDAAQELQE